MISADDLLTDTKALVKLLVEDLRETVASEDKDRRTLDEEYRRANQAGRTSLTKDSWAEGFYAQVAVAWVLGCVFVRFCEDNELVADSLLAGPGERLAIARDHRAAYLHENPAHDDRHWLREIFGRLKALPATGDVFGEHNPVWLMAPSADGARKLVQQFQAIDPKTGSLRHDFTNPAWDTRFLGDLYQELSEHAKKTYALLQTPEFIESFILDRTLEPAIRTFGLKTTTLLDPTCGSGHFLLGAFNRLFQHWQEAEPQTNPRELASRACASVAGVDINPFAAAIARFRLLVAALRAGGDRRLSDAPTYLLQIAVGDSLLHGDLPGRLGGILEGDELTGAGAHGYATEDVENARRILNREWHAVVGNPPYITVKDPALNKLYRMRLQTCHRHYSLGVPFTERFFQLAKSEGAPEYRGYVGMITASTFMKREFGKKLIEQWVPNHDLTHVIDTNFASIPGHTIPTVILLGRNRVPIADRVRVVMGTQGERTRSADPRKGLVWLSIVDLVDKAGSSSEYVSVVDLERARLTKHPWSIGGGGAAELKQSLDGHSRRLGLIISEVGRTTHTGEDDVYVMTPAALKTRSWLDEAVPLVEGAKVRDWRIDSANMALFPYDRAGGQAQAPKSEDLRNHYWTFRTHLRSRLNFGQTNEERGLGWHEYTMFFPRRFLSPLSIAFAFVASHNHFVLDRGGKVFNRSAPVIKLPADVDERTHLEIAGVLNSSTGCFWMKQVFQKKTQAGGGGGAAEASFTHQFEHDGSKLMMFPLPDHLDSSTATLLDHLAADLESVTPCSMAEASVPDLSALEDARKRYMELRAELIAAQERLDWEVYRNYGLLVEDLTTGDEPEPPLQLGERAFEILLARRMAVGEEESSWFARHDSSPRTDLPRHWTDSYRSLVERRIEIIQTAQDISLIERPENKRRWATKSWEEQLAHSLRSWMLDRLEEPDYWPEEALTSTARLAARARGDADFVQVAEIYRGTDVDVALLVAELVKSEAVPYRAVQRYAASGIRKHRQWLETWDLQRREDAGECVGRIPVPPKYKKGDFQGLAWNHRGKLDVPKERFISYPGAEREGDTSLVVGWAGWNQLTRARALAGWYLQAKKDGRDHGHLSPMLEGLAELVPWLKQWHDDSNLDPQLDRPGTQIATFLEEETRAIASRR